jgi:hypothetical protein
MPAEGDAVHEHGAVFEERLGHLVGHHHPAQRCISGGEALGHGDHVGLRTHPLGPEVGAEAAEGADHLVGHQEHAVAVADLPHPLEVAGGRGEATARVLHRFEEHRRNGVGALPQNGPLDVVGALEGARGARCAERAAISIGVLHVDAAGHQRLEQASNFCHTGERERPHGGAVVGGLAGDRLVTLRLATGGVVLAGQLPCRLDRLAAAGGEEHTIEVARGQLGQSGRQLDRHRMGVGPQGEVGQRLGLLGHGVGDRTPSMTGVHGVQPGQAVEVPLAVGIPDITALTSIDDGNLGWIRRRQLGKVAPGVAG